LNVIRSIFEPGCGTGLLGKELENYTDALYSGMDIDEEILPGEGNFISCDAIKHPFPADLYVTSFFFSSVKDPVLWLKKVSRKLSPGGLFAVFAEYDYQSIQERPASGLAERIRNGLEKSGIYTVHGGELDRYFSEAGFCKLHGDDVFSEFQTPDTEFLETHIERLPEELPMMSWRVVWGIWRTG